MESPAVANAVKAFTSLKREQIATLNETLSGFFFCLGAPDSAAFAARDILNEASWNNRANWSQAEWLSWETWAWYQHFCRMVSVWAVSIVQYLTYFFRIPVFPISPELRIVSGHGHLSSRRHASGFCNEALQAYLEHLMRC